MVVRFVEQVSLKPKMKEQRGVEDERGDNGNDKPSYEKM